MGYNQQDLYLSVGLQTAHGRDEEKSTRVHEGRDGTVRWEDEKISIKYSNAGDGVVAEVGGHTFSQNAEPTFFLGTKEHATDYKIRHEHHRFWVAYL